MIDVLRLVRGHNLLIAAAGVLAGGWIALGELTTPRLLALAALSGVGLGAAGNALNDLHDAPADRVNRSATERPLASGRLQTGTAELCTFLGVVIGLSAAALVSGLQVVAGLVALGVMAVYSPLLKRRGLPGNLAVAAIAGVPPFYGALAVGRPAAGLVPWVLAAWIHAVREIVKDLEDEPGDRVAGRRTLPIVLGRSRALAVAGFLALGFVPAALGLPLVTGYGARYFPLASVALLVVLLAAGSLRRGRVARVGLLLKVAMVAGMVALVAGRVA